ncbi:biotin--[acetyl-CoA-carboxylase] ligase [Dokdonia sp. Hel_I_53]|uniref:biotin--[acetyl-CoA-carboxylase] ligase n=1 Tax=Dokdonia sp. Hel_I_53 TaxID=1566287 RepID=UPI00119BBC16|nr:biotin--[acetyl-CoA-carboxylase] ligase [Dokdonia sp. Hel_I_53]TVZ52094.1 BirA family biotin operon repressor/biotin-[acetyl-CoA-carboxylase] ligase [Dokdonia sp. Hel_I_53]
MRIDKLHTIDSTNDYLKRISKKENTQEDMVVWAKNQTAGRGQMGTKWMTQTDKNLTFSVYRKIQRITIDEQFFALMAASLAIKDVLTKLLIKNVRVKWPNDILTDNDKICGILIESVIKKGRLDAMIIGVGLNVNQTEWSHLPRATSIKKQTGIHFKLEEILQMLLEQFRHYVQLLIDGKFEKIKKDYENCLFKRNKPATFLKPNGEKFVGIIKGTTNSGKLILLQENDVLKEYDLKELQLLY